MKTPKKLFVAAYNQPQLDEFVVRSGIPRNVVRRVETARDLRAAPARSTLVVLPNADAGRDEVAHAVRDWQTAGRAVLFVSVPVSFGDHPFPWRDLAR